MGLENVVSLIPLIVIIALWCWGFYNAFREGQIFGMTGDWMRANVRERWLKPIIGCPVCMPSIHGAILYLMISSEFYFVSLAILIVCASGLNFVIKEHLYNAED
jgi:hypothetical protein